MRLVQIDVADLPSVPTPPALLPKVSLAVIRRVRAGAVIAII